MKNITISLCGIIITIFMLILVAGCSSDGSGSQSAGSTTTDQGTGNITALLDWGTTSKTTAKTVESAPAGVATMRFTISGSGITQELRKEFPALAGSGTITGVPAGTNRTVTAEALDSSGIITHKGTATNITVVTGQTADAGTIIMNTTGVSMNMEQTNSDQAQITTLAFSAFAMVTGNLGAQSFFPPGKIADYTGFQYLRDNDPDNYGHNTSFLTRIRATPPIRAKS